MTLLQYPKEITFADSPCLVVLEDSDSLLSILTTFSIKLYIWRGFKSSVPTDPAYTFEIQGIEQPHLNGSDYKYADIEIGRFLKEFIEDGYIENNMSYNGNNGCWYKISYESNISSIISSPTQFATLGYSFMLDGVNKGTTISEENGQVFGNQSTKLIVSSGEDYIIPVFIGQTSSNIFFNNNISSLSLSSLGLVTNSDLSQRQIGYINIGKTLFGNSWVCGKTFKYNLTNSLIISQNFTYTFPFQLGGLIIPIPIENEYCLLIEKTRSDCKIKYLNSYGAYTELPCNGEFNEDLKIKRVTYSNQFLNPYNLDYDRHFERTHKVTSSKVYKVTTDWLFEDSNIMIEELLISKKVYLKVDGVNYPVTILDKSKKYINRKFKRTIGYSFTCRVNKNYENLIR